jgi:predicted protein tyrosine phosphatase
MNLLFICSYGEIRSVTAANIYGGRSIGLHRRYTTIPTEVHKKKMEKLCKWADKIYIFEDLKDYNKRTFEKYYPQFIDKVKILPIQDVYGEVNHPKLVEKIKKYLRCDFCDIKDTISNAIRVNPIKYKSLIVQSGKACNKCKIEDFNNLVKKIKESGDSK